MSIADWCLLGRRPIRGTNDPNIIDVSDVPAQWNQFWAECEPVTPDETKLLDPDQVHDAVWTGDDDE